MTRPTNIDNPKVERCVSVVRRNPGITAPEVAREFGQSISTVYGYLLAAYDQGKLRKEGSGPQTRRWFAVESQGESFPRVSSIWELARLQ